MEGCVNLLEAPEKKRYDVDRAVAGRSSSSVVHRFTQPKGNISEGSGKRNEMHQIAKGPAVPAETRKNVSVQFRDYTIVGEDNRVHQWKEADAIGRGMTIMPLRTGPRPNSDVEAGIVFFASSIASASTLAHARSEGAPVRPVMNSPNARSLSENATFQNDDVMEEVFEDIRDYGTVGRESSIDGSFDADIALQDEMFWKGSVSSRKVNGNEEFLEAEKIHGVVSRDEDIHISFNTLDEDASLFGNHESKEKPQRGRREQFTLPIDRQAKNPF